MKLKTYRPRMNFTEGFQSFATASSPTKVMWISRLNKMNMVFLSRLGKDIFKYILNCLLERCREGAHLPIHSPDAWNRKPETQFKFKLSFFLRKFSVLFTTKVELWILFNCSSSSLTDSVSLWKLEMFLLLFCDTIP